MRQFVLSLVIFLLQINLAGAQSPSQQWVVSTAQGSDLFAQSWATRTSFPQDFIKEQWQEKKFITALNYGGGLWNAVMSKGTPYNKQTWATRQVFPADMIKEKWEDNYNITEVAYGQSAWAFVFTQTPAIQGQTYKLSSTFPAEFIQNHWDKGYFINGIAYGQGQWMIVLSQSGVQKKQSYIKSKTFPKEWIQEKLEQDYEITETAFGDGYWAVVATQEGQYNCSIVSNNSFPKNEISLAWAKEKAITSVAFGYLPGEHLLIKADDPQTIAVSNSSPPTPAEKVSDGRPTLHLICAMDTRDRLLGLGARHALEAVSDQFAAAAQSTGLKLNQVVISDTDFTKAGLKETLDEINAGSEDVLVFYYFGHGFRYTNNNSRFPICFIGKNGIDHPEKAALPLTDIYQTLNDKKARLTLVFAECCNNEIGVPAPVDSYIASRPMSVSFSSKDRYKSLFLTQKGSILLASSDIGQASWATSTGGYFLDSFMDAFQYHVSDTNKEPPSWNSLLNDTQKRVIKLAQAKNRVQEPIFSIQLK